MEIRLAEVKNRKDLKSFIYLPEKIHAQHETWTPPVYFDEFQYFNPQKNRAFSYCDSVLVLAYRDEKLVGRVMGLVNSRFNEIQKAKTARFTYLETYQDQEVVHALLAHVENWARNKGMDKLVGPYGFTDQDPQGFLVQGFDHPATIVTIHNYPWMTELVENEGYSKEMDYVVYKLDLPDEIPSTYKKILERVRSRNNFELVTIKNKKEAKTWIEPVFQLMNETYLENNIYGYTPIDELEMKGLVKKFLMLLDMDLLKIVKKDGEVVSFLLGMQDISEGIRAARGRLFPLGWWKIIQSQKHTKQLDLLLGATKEKYRGLGLDVLMAVDMIISAKKKGLEIVDTHSEMETNMKTRSIMEKLGGKIYKRFRVYQKAL
ncbi:MAG: GNAT family N-acetyltransferase [Pseudomonadota bacterium]